MSRLFVLEEEVGPRKSLRDADFFGMMHGSRRREEGVQRQRRQERDEDGRTWKAMRGSNPGVPKLVTEEASDELAGRK
jgi:hypothetical protein